MDKVCEESLYYILFEVYAILVDYVEPIVLEKSSPLPELIPLKGVYVTFVSVFVSE